jgi:hypothetical protein
MTASSGSAPGTDWVQKLPVIGMNSQTLLGAGRGARNVVFAGSSPWHTLREDLLAMQKVEGSNPFSRFLPANRALFDPVSLPRQLSRPSSPAGELPANPVFRAAPLCVSVLAEGQRFERVWPLAVLPAIGRLLRRTERQAGPAVPAGPYSVHIHGGLDDPGQRLVRVPALREMDTGASGR